MFIIDPFPNWRAGFKSIVRFRLFIYWGKEEGSTSRVYKMRGKMWIYVEVCMNFVRTLSFMGDRWKSGDNLPNRCMGSEFETGG